MGSFVQRHKRFATALLAMGVAGAIAAFFLRGEGAMRQVVLVVAVAYAVWMVGALVASLAQRKRDEKDIEATCRPILEAYGRDRDASALLDAYAVWREGSHGDDVRFQFPQALISALADDCRSKEAHLLLDDLSSMAGDRRTRELVAAYRVEVEDRLAKARVNQARQAKAKGKVRRR